MAVLHNRIVLWKLRTQLLYPAIYSDPWWSLQARFKDGGEKDPANAQLPLWSGQYTVMASLMNWAACALSMPVDSSSV
jgi:hypothetical protein